MPAVIEVATPVGPVRLATSAKTVNQRVTRLAGALVTHRLAATTNQYVLLTEPPWPPLFADEERYAELIMQRLYSVCENPDRCPHGIQLATTPQDVEAASREAAEFDRWRNAERSRPTKAAMRDWIDRPR